MSEASTILLGFFAVVEYPQHGLFGGYLLLNAAGRPVEFHCTAPVKPNRAQQILYGPTLESFLYGEHIGATLIKASQQTPLALLVDQPAALAVRQHINVPAARCAANAPHGGDLPLFQAGSDLLEIGANRLSVSSRHRADRDQLACAIDVRTRMVRFQRTFRADSDRHRRSATGHQQSSRMNQPRGTVPAEH